MRRIILLTVAAALCLSAAGAFAQDGDGMEKRVIFNPQVGVTSSQYSDDPEDAKAEGRIGWALGAFMRYGERFYFQPGVFYQKTGVELKSSPGSIEDITSTNDVSSIWVPVEVGLDIIQGDVFLLRANAGGTATIVTSVHDNDLGLEKDDYKSVWWGGIIGVGADFIQLITVDLSYEIGLSKVFEEIDGVQPDSKQNTFRAMAGLRF